MYCEIMIDQKKLSLKMMHSLPSLNIGVVVKAIRQEKNKYKDKKEDITNIL